MASVLLLLLYKGFQAINITVTNLGGGGGASYPN